MKSATNRKRARVEKFLKGYARGIYGKVGTRIVITDAIVTEYMEKANTLDIVKISEWIQFKEEFLITKAGCEELENRVYVVIKRLDTNLIL